MSFDREVLRPIPPGWVVPPGAVPVHAGETRLGAASLKIVDAGIVATITLDGEVEEWPEDVKIGVVGQIIRSHFSPATGDNVVDEVRVRGLEVG